jgi:hypothetical protein
MTQQRMEHNEIVAAAKAAFDILIDKSGSEGVSQSQVSEYVLTEHAGLDPLRLERCIDILWKQLDQDHYDEAEQEALFEQQIRHAMTLSPHEGAAYLKKCADEAELEADKAAVHAFQLGLETRVLKRYGKNDETTLTDVILQLGVEGYVQAIREELLDGDVDAGMVAIQGHTRTYRYKLTDILDSKRKFAEEVIRRVRKEIEAWR